jgi:hypothetical protein
MGLDQTRFNIILISALVLVGVAGLIILTRQGIGTSPDSVVYLGSARNLLDGYGLSVPYGPAINLPMTHYPPLYPLLIALSGAFSADLLQGARVIHILLFGANLFLIGLIINSLLPGNLWMLAVGLALMFASQTMLIIHAMAWSEPLFIFLGFSGLYFLANYLRLSQRLQLSVSAVLIGLTFLTRYAGVAFLMSGALAILLFGRKSLRHKFIDVILFGAVSCLPTAVWMVRNMILSGTLTNRELLFHPINTGHLVQFVDILSTWVSVPLSIPAKARLVLLLGAFAFALWFYFWQRHKRAGSAPRGDSSSGQAKTPELLMVIVLFVIIYIFFIIFSISFIDANTPIDERILSPVFVGGWIVILYLAGRFLVLKEVPRFAKLLAILALGLISFSYLLQGVEWLSENQSTGFGYSGLKWEQSETLNQVMNLSPGLLVYTNRPEPIYLASSRPVMQLPNSQNSATQQGNPQYRLELEQVREQLEQAGGIVVYFTELPQSSISEEEHLREILGLCLWMESGDGRIYTLAHAGQPCQLPQEDQQ